MIHKRAEIIAVGTELLLGQILNRDAYWLAGQLSELGISSYHQQVVGDHRGRLKEAIELALSRADLVLLSGGLGPTDDDLTMSVAAEVSGRCLVTDAASRLAISQYFSERSPDDIPANNWKQAELPEGAEVLPNQHGTAPGVRLDFDWRGEARTLVLLPGPPQELQPMFLALKPSLLEESPMRFRHVYLNFVGIGESALSSQLADLFSTQERISLATYAQDGLVQLRLSQWLSKTDPADDSELLWTGLLSEVQARVGLYLTHEGQLSLAAHLLRRCREEGRQLVLAESVTGGMLASQLVDVPGASETFIASLVSYQERAKEKILAVPSQVLKSCSAVSAETALAMSEGLYRQFPEALCLSVTGVAGPGADAANKPEGLVYLSLKDRGFYRVYKLQIRGDRERIRRASCQRAWQLLLYYLDKRLLPPNFEQV